MKKIIKDKIDLNELNGTTIGTWLNTLRELQNRSTTISVHADNFYDGGCNIEMSFERLETDEEYQNRIEREDYLGQIKIKDAELRFAIALLSNLTSKYN